MEIQIGDYIIELASLNLAILAMLFVVLIALIYAKIKLAKSGQITRSLNMVILQVSVSKNIEKQSQDKKEEQKEYISIMEQLFSSLSNIREEMAKKIIYGPFYLSFEIATPIDSKEIFFYVSVPKKFQSIIEKQINSFYQDAEIKRVDDYNIFVPNGGSAASYMTLKKRHIFPIKTYQQLETDPLLNITNAFSKIPNGEGAALQIIIKPIGNIWQKESKDTIRLMQKGKGFESGHVESSFIMKMFKEFIGIFFTGGTKTDEQRKQEEAQVNLTPEQEETIKAVETKSTKIGFETNVRLVASAQTKEKAQTLLKELENSFSQFNAPNLNSFKITETFLNKAGFLNKTIYNFIFRSFEKSRKIILNTEELSSIFHFPIATTDTPQIKWLKSKQAPPPNNITDEGLLLGYNAYRGDKTEIKIGKDDRRRHMYTIGQTGTGKSAFLGELIKQDIRNGEGLCVIDPHGDLVESALECVPKERADDVILFDPSNVQNPLGLNLLEYDENYPEQKTFVINEMIKIFDKLYDLKATGGPMFEQYMRNAMLLIMDDPSSGSTLIEISKVLADADFRKYKLSKCQNYIVKNFWEKEAEKAGGEAALANMVPYITSKLTQFISNDTMRPIIGQQKSSINFREIMDNRKIILVNLSKGKIGEMNAYLLGLVIVGKILVSSLSRTDIPQEERKDFYLYIDEFQNFTTDSISTILSEARKYRLVLNIAHQFLGQLPEEIQKSVFGNVGTIVSFRIGPEDAEFMTKQFTPNFNEQDLINIDNYNAYVKLMMNGTISEGFNMTTYPPVKGSRELAEAIKKLSTLKYGRDREVVEREIRERSEVGKK
ncbi:MAG: type IV secretion system DNA-binding domain-containing protein [Candidatus Pacebacteria bacterium]|nr:type IV secretion system DNA-binding domain-containing protein [Candidatus Paceibacterota bacterium]